MFDIGWSEIFIIAFLALILLGPKEIPVVLRTVTNLIRRLRGMAADLQQGMDRIIRETELDEIKKDLQKINPQHLAQNIESAIDLPPLSSSPMMMIDPEKKSDPALETKPSSPPISPSHPLSSGDADKTMGPNPSTVEKDSSEKGSTKTAS